MTAGILDRVNPRRGGGTHLTPLGEDRQKSLPRIVAAACEAPLKEGFPPDADGWAWHIGLGSVDVGAPLPQKSAGNKEARATPGKLSRSGAGWHQLGPRSSAQAGRQDLERPASVPSFQDPDRSEGLYGTTRKGSHQNFAHHSSNPALLRDVGPSLRPERSGTVARGAAERSAAALLAPSSSLADRPERCTTSEGSRMSTPGWVPPASRGSLASRQSTAQRNASRQGLEVRRRQAQLAGGVDRQCRQRPTRAAPAAGLSLPASCFETDSKLKERPASRSPSPEMQTEKRCAIDDSLSIPKSLFDSLLQAGREARGRGQHYLDKKRPGGPKLVNTDLKPGKPGSKSRVDESNVLNHHRSAPSFRTASSSTGAAKNPQVLSRVMATLDGAMNHF